jgi:ABC-type Fe3+ transport system substrate-binding protein
MKISRLALLTVVFVFAMGFVSFAGAQDAAWQKVLAAAKKEGIVNVSSSPISGKAAVTVMDEFKKKYGVQIEFVPGRAQVMVEKISMEQVSKSYVMDAMETHGSALIELMRKGYIDDPSGDLPELRAKDKFAFTIREKSEGKEIALLNYLYLFSNIWINTDLVKPGDEPKSWYDLLDPKWKGKMMLTNPLYGSGPELLMIAFTKNKTGLNEDFFVKLFKNCTLGGPGGAGDVVDKLSRGEIAVGGVIVGSTGVKPMLEGAHIKPLDLKEGSLFQPVKWGMMKNAPHANATKVYANWLLSKEGQTIVTKATGLASVRNDVPSSLPFRLNGPKVMMTYEDLLKAEEMNSKDYMANLLGLKR